MKKRASKMPDQFASDNERWYWHEAQDIAWRAGVEMVLREGVVYLVSDEGERRVPEPEDANHIWYYTWLALGAEYPEHARSWVKGRPISKPGE